MFLLDNTGLQKCVFLHRSTVGHIVYKWRTCAVDHKYQSVLIVLNVKVNLRVISGKLKAPLAD